jgi:uncharacterized protein
MRIWRKFRGAKRSHQRSEHARLLFMGDQLVSNQVLDRIRGELTGVKKHDEAVKIFESYGIRAHSQAISYLGYKVKWSGLDPEEAEIIKM